VNIRKTFLSLLLVCSTVVAAPSALAVVTATAKQELASGSALLIDLKTNEVLYSSNPDMVVPIASVTKLMTAMVVDRDGGDRRQAADGSGPADHHQGRPRDAGCVLASAHRQRDQPRRDASAHPDVLRKPRGSEPGAPLSGRLQRPSSRR